MDLPATTLATPKETHHHFQPCPPDTNDPIDKSSHDSITKTKPKAVRIEEIDKNQQHSKKRPVETATQLHPARESLQMDTQRNTYTSSCDKRLKHQADNSLNLLQCVPCVPFLFAHNIYRINPTQKPNVLHTHSSKFTLRSFKSSSPSFHCNSS